MGRGGKLSDVPSAQIFCRHIGSLVLDRFELVRANQTRVRIFILPEQEACGHAYGTPCINWGPDKIKKLEENPNVQIDQKIPNDGKLIIRKIKTREFLQNYDKNTVHAKCIQNDGKATFAIKKIPFQRRYSTVFLFDFPTGSTRLLRIARTVRCDGKIVRSAGHEYREQSRIYHERAEYLYWGNEVEWEISYLPEKKCYRMKSFNPDAGNSTTNPTCTMIETQ